MSYGGAFLVIGAGLVLSLIATLNLRKAAGSAARRIENWRFGAIYRRSF